MYSEQAIGFLKDHLQDQPSLEEIAAHVHLSPYHFQRIFTRWAGISIYYGSHHSPFGKYLHHNQERTSYIASILFQPDSFKPLSLLVRGTNFQLKVWEALLKIPFGGIVSYQTIAEYVKNPKGLQAVGSAIGKNPVAYLIPCHRVIKNQPC